MKALWVLLAMGTAAWTQEASTGDSVRELWSTEFRKARAESAPTAPKPTGKPQAPAAKPATPEPTLIGVTVWLLRPSNREDPAVVRALVHEKGNRPHTPVRVSSGGQFYEGDHLRLTLESGRAGYLYVVSRERYANGSFGSHQLIFPTTRLRRGDNYVRAGFPVELPSSSDDPSYLTLVRNGKEHTGEELLFIVAPRPLSDVTISERPLELSEPTVRSWQAKWASKTQSIEIPDGQDRILSPEELKLLREGGRFGERDPLPQTLYRVQGKPDQPVLVGFQLHMNQRPTR